MNSIMGLIELDEDNKENIRIFYKKTQNARQE